MFLQVVVLAMRKLGIALENVDNEALVDYMISVYKTPDFDYSSEFFERAGVLWNDAGVKAAFERSHEYQLIDSAG